MDEVEVSRANRDDISQFYKKTKPDQKEFPTVIAWIARLDGEPVALWGVTRTDSARWIAFFDLTDAARPYKKRIVRNARSAMEEFRRMGIRYVYAQIDDEEPTAERFQRFLGFEDDPRAPGLMRWKNDEAR